MPWPPRGHGLGNGDTHQATRQPVVLLSLVVLGPTTPAVLAQGMEVPPAQDPEHPGVPCSAQLKGSFSHHPGRGFSLLLCSPQQPPGSGDGPRLW